MVSGDLLLDNQLTQGPVLYAAWVSWRILYRLVLWPRFLSPLRVVPGPPLGGIIAGQFPAIIQGEAGVPQREWVKQHGSAVRVVGPLGIERLIFTKADTLHKILVSEWMEHPRVRLSYLYLSRLC